MEPKTERRARVRFPIELRVRYETLGKKLKISGVGRTLNLSSAGMIVASKDEFLAGTRLEVALEWPSLLQGTTPLQLVVICKVVRSTKSAFAVELQRHQFRTMSRGAANPGWRRLSVGDWSAA
jgi:hypothetical protein